MKIAELFAELGFDVNTKGIEQFKGELNSGMKDMGLFIAKAGALVYAVNRIASASIRAATNIKAFTSQTGIAGDEIQRLQNLAQLTDFNVSAEQIASSVKNLQQNLADIRLGGGDVSAFNLLGISIQGKDAVDIISELAGSMQGLDQATKANLIQKLGLDPSFVQVLDSANSEMLALANQYILSDEATSQLSALGTSFSEFGMMVAYTRDQLSALFAPSLKIGIELLRGAFDLLMVPLRLIGSIFQSISIQLESLNVSIENSKSALQLLGAVALVVMAPFAKWGMIITGILFVLEDLFMALTGGKSIIGTFFDGIMLNIERIKDGIKSLFQPLRDGISDALDPIAGWIDKLIVQPILSAIDAFKTVKNFFTGSNASASDSETEIIEETSIYQDISSFFKDAFDVGKSVIDSAPDILGDTSRSIGQNITNGFNNIFNIVTPSPQEAANAVAGTMQQQINQSYTEINNAGAY